MKMPWSFLLRRRTPNPSPNEIADVKEASDTEDESSADLVDQPSVATPNPVEHPAPATNFKESSEASAPAARVDDETHLAARAADIPNDRPPASSGPRRSLSALRKQRGKASAAPRNNQPTLSKAKTQKSPLSDSEPRPIDPFASGASVLDEEIKQLRLQLAEKLRLQNAQLKEMLQRFDPS
ncbi:hypothetical protein [Rhizobium leguminosarum]|uniref:hypothetical protein n=1 Tax=Rhizobium leguminosarum TaxID=384 RepID=UPI001031A298|nr:hypothetical protein [Rhizobium leguminosarum]MBY5416065.1 hypothetical protein [Rhizobium leguminosarum]TBF82583.1 hypothetical protein ELG86_10790 [Rhizobium leguminosarum]TBH36524.1 hypothetical protein ELG66_12075 [Rhizobium leguminosarum]TBH41727.1 hypothetical protein ELG63_10290 [Rhizobium leguminosarum]TBH62284.1 hypothetical protein ELG61_38650 [Rhizobium leguminosarum]